MITVLVGGSRKQALDFLSEVKGDFVSYDGSPSPSENRKQARILISTKGQEESSFVYHTNSDWFVEELANLIRLGSKGKKGENEAKNFGFQLNWLIDFSKIKVFEHTGDKYEPVVVTQRGFKISEFVKERKHLDMVTKKSLSE